MPVKDITLRDCREDDRAFVWEVRRQALRDYVAAIWGWDEQAQHAKFEQEFTPAGHQIIVVDGRDVGLLQVVDDGTHLVVGKIELLPEFQRQGIGTDLMTRILGGAQSRAIPVRLQVLRTNTGARRLYERLGFVVSSETESHFQMKFEARPGMSPVDEARVEKLCPGLRRVVNLELQAGNWVDETWEGWGFVVLLGAPFSRQHDLASGELTYRDVDDPHYWKSEYHCRTHDQSVACRFKSHS